jgi:hypothetical protein
MTSFGVEATLLKSLITRAWLPFLAPKALKTPGLIPHSDRLYCATASLGKRGALQKNRRIASSSKRMI